MGEIEPADRRCGMHGEIIRQMNTGDSLSIQKVEQGTLFRMVGTSRIAGCRTNTRIFLFDQLFILQVFVRSIGPEFLTNPFVHPFSKGFSKPVCKGFGQNAIIVIVIRFELRDQLITTQTGGDRKATKIILDTRIFRSHKIGKAIVGLILDFFNLLTETVNRCLLQLLII